MKQITKKSIAMYITFAILIIFLTGAECTIGGCSVTFNDYTAKAVNIKTADSTSGFYKDDSTGDTLVGTIVSLYPYDSATGGYSSSAYDTAVVQYDGSFTFFAPISNRYKLTATSTDWVFVPQYIEITNSGAAVKDLYAYPKDSAGEYTIIASWENTDMDVDLTLTYGQEAASTTNLWVSGDTEAVGERLRIYYNGRGSTNGTGVSLDMDITPDDPDSISRVETISIHDATWFNPGDTIKVYLDTPLSADVLTGLEGTDPSAFAQVDMMYYNDSTGSSEHFGTWYIPWNTFENSLQIIEIEYDGSKYSIGSANNADTLYGGIKGIIWE